MPPALTLSPSPGTDASSTVSIPQNTPVRITAPDSGLSDVGPANDLGTSDLEFAGMSAATPTPVANALPGSTPTDLELAGDSLEDLADLAEKLDQEVAHISPDSTTPISAVGTIDAPSATPVSPVDPAFPASTPAVEPPDLPVQPPTSLAQPSTLPLQAPVTPPTAQPPSFSGISPQAVQLVAPPVAAAASSTQPTTSPPSSTSPAHPTLSDSSQSVSTPSESLDNPPSEDTPPSAPPVADPPEDDSTMQYANLLDVLTAKFGLDKGTADKLMMDHIGTGASLEELVTKDNLVVETDLSKAKGILNHIPWIDLSQIGIYPEALQRLPEGVARNYRMLPFALDKDNGTISVAMADPLDLSAIDFAQQKTGLRVIAHYATPSELERRLAEYYSQSLSTEVTEALEQTIQANETKTRKNFADLSKETIRQAPISKIVETILTFAIKARASDVHIEPMEQQTRVRYRIDGMLTEKLILPRNVHDAVVSRIKILSNLKIDEKRIPQDGRFNFVAAEQEVDLRVSTLPTIHGEKIVMRLLKKDQNVPSLPELGLNGLSLRNVQDSIKVPHGIVLITGPTGSGKTTTLYSILHTINTPKVNIVTLEDPVEYQIGGINQVQTNPQAGLTFASGLRSFLRQDPNIIMVGEIRDSETAELAIQASLTGHLVFSTLHTSSAAGALPRLMDMGAEPFLLASSMTLVMAQRVLRVINPDFKEEYEPDAAVVADIKAVLADKFEPWCRQHGKDPNRLLLTRPAAHRPSTEPEYKGRIAIFEVMKITEEIARLILERKPATEMEKLALRDGMLLMKQDGYLKVLEGLTTIEEVLRVAQI